MTDSQEEGIRKYRQIEREISDIEDKIISLYEKGISNSGYVSLHNNKVDELERVAKIYCLI